MYSAFLDELENLRQRTARFRRVALHVHSPDSHDWGRGGDAEKNHRSRFDGAHGRRTFAEALSPHLDLVCITDHMKCGFATLLSGEADGFLPGMEVNLRIEPLEFPRVHVVTILPPGCTPEGFSCLFANQPHIPKEDAKRTGQEEVRGLTLKQWVDLVHGEGGLCVAAHVESSNGVRLVFRQVAQDVLKLFVPTDDPTKAEQEHDVPDTLKNYLFDSGVDAIEVRKTTDAKHYRWTSPIDGRTRSIATILTFDAHTCEAFNRPDHVTHIKMTSLGIGGLKTAFRFPDTRIRFPGNLPSGNVPRIQGISIKGTHDSFFKDITVALSENLNCIIGVRGSGKSTIVEALRYVFGYNRTLSDLDKPMAESVRSMQRANLAGTVIRVLYRLRNGDDRILEATFDDKADYATNCLSVSGDALEIADVEKCGDHPLRLFGWSELETLGRSPARQRDLLDRLIPELGILLRQRADLRRELATNRSAINTRVSTLRRVWGSGQITRFREFTADFDKLNTPEVQQAFIELDIANAKLRILGQVLRNVDAQIDTLQSVSSITLRNDLEHLLSESIQQIREWWNADELQRLGILKVEAEISGLAQQAVQRLLAFREVVTVRIEECEVGVSRLEETLRASFDENDDDSMQRIYDLRTNAERRLRLVAETRRSYLDGWQQLQAAIAERLELCKRLESVQNEIAGIRSRRNSAAEATLNRFLPDWMKVTIAFTAGADKDAFAERVKDIVPGRANTPWVVRVRELCLGSNPVSCATAVLQDKMEEFRENEWLWGNVEATPGDVDQWKSVIAPFEHHDHADVPVLAEDGQRLNSVLALQETEWDDSAVILLDGGPINEKSPGQRASAMLPLIALAEDAPLIIDQPEDNLDKRLVGGVLMRVLAELKEKRQITVCTHDPNIVVGGDAEQVVVMNAENHRRGAVEMHGSIDDEGIVKKVIELLEGGAEAFEARQRRYGLIGPSLLT